MDERMEGNALSTARKVRGVERVDNQLDVHATPGSVPGLQ